VIPLVFARSRGWLTLPPAGQAVREGIVFFGAYGVEELSTRYSLAQLATRLAAAGHPVLRFDWPGTGDALGDWDAAAQLPSWVEAGRAAVQALQQHSGVQPVCLLGLRLGGMVATLVAQALQAAGTPVQGLALLAPVLQGRQYIREMRALSHGTEPLAVAGFPFSRETQEAIAALDLSTMAQPPAARVFLGVPSATKAMDTVQAQWGTHAHVHSAAYPDLAQHIGNPTMSRAPAELFDALVAWFAQQPPVAGAPVQVQHGANLPTRLADAHFVEDGAIIPAEVGLAAVWCQPAQAASAGAVVVFCNAGRNSHVGWARGTVTMARQLAAAGIASVRFDLAGLGDSPPLPNPPAEVLYSTAAIPQLRAVVDHVRRAQGEKTAICVMGSCSGGYLAFHQALSDVRIAALVLVNVQRWVWKEGMSLQAAMRSTGRSTQAYRQRMWQRDTWMRLLRGEVDVAAVLRALGARVLRAVRLPSGDLGRTRRGFSALADRECRVSVVYSEDDGGRDEFARYFGDNASTFTALPHTQLTVLPDADHDLSDRAAREVVMGVLQQVVGQLHSADTSVFKSL
jgi:pimeloyl-ACP methyl ester carboxylesterase